MFCYFVNNFSYSADWCVLHWEEGGEGAGAVVGMKWKQGDGWVSAVGLCSVAVHSSTL